MASGGVVLDSRLLDVIADDPGFTRAIGPELERAYTQVMSQVWNHLDPQELRIVVRQAAELKAKKRF